MFFRNGTPPVTTRRACCDSAPQLRVVSDPVRGSSWITGQLRKAIHDGAYANGEKLPAERQLAEAFGTSRTTVRMALDQLVYTSSDSTQASKVNAPPTGNDGSWT